MDQTTAKARYNFSRLYKLTKKFQKKIPLFLCLNLDHRISTNLLWSELARSELRRLAIAVKNVISLWRLEEGNSGFSLYDFSQMKGATNGFSIENKLGQGGFGAVYKVYLCHLQWYSDIHNKSFALSSNQVVYICLVLSGSAAWWTWNRSEKTWPMFFARLARVQEWDPAHCKASAQESSQAAGLLYWRGAREDSGLWVHAKQKPRPHHIRYVYICSVPKDFLENLSQ